MHKRIVTSELVIHTNITRGSEGAVTGVIGMEQGEKFAFCEVYRVASAFDRTIRSMMTYTIQQNGGQ